MKFNLELRKKLNSGIHRINNLGVNMKTLSKFTNKKHVIITIRYSLLMHSSKSWRISKDSNFDEYKNNLLNPKRLEVRETIFKSITLPSLAYMYEHRPDDVNFKVLIITTDLLPHRNKNFLDDVQTQYPFIDVQYHSPENANTLKITKSFLNSHVKSGEMYASVRLDDDDALSLTWLNKITSYIQPEFNNMIISLSNGFAGILNTEGKITHLCTYKWHFASIGLTYIGTKSNHENLTSIYHCGNHIRVDEKYPTIMDSSQNYIFRTFNDYNDSKSSFPKNNLIEQNHYIHHLNDFFIKIN